MMSERVINDPLLFSNRALELHRNLSISIAPFYKKDADINEFNQILLTELFTQLYSTAESILILTSYGVIWESDILLRTLFEGTMKYIFMMQEHLEEKSDLIEEYYIIVPEMQKIQDHAKAAEAIKIFKENGIDKHSFQVSLLENEELVKLKEAYSKNRIRELNQKWSYKNILRNLIEKDNKYDILATTLYTYSLSSHLIHYDGECLKQRAGALINNVVNNDEMLDTAHLLRIISNVVSLGTLRVSEYIKVYNLDVEQYDKKFEDNFIFLNEIEEINNKIINGKY